MSSSLLNLPKSIQRTFEPAIFGAFLCKDHGSGLHKILTFCHFIVSALCQAIFCFCQRFILSCGFSRFWSNMRLMLNLFTNFFEYIR